VNQRTLPEMRAVLWDSARQNRQTMTQPTLKDRRNFAGALIVAIFDRESY
jgi:hypothetical protein